MLLRVPLRSKAAYLNFKDPPMPKNEVSNLITEQVLDQETERQRRKDLRREQVLDRLWEISKMSPEMTRGSITGQVKALAMIVAIEGLIPDRRAEKNSAPPLPEVNIYPAAWLGRQQEKSTRSPTRPCSCPGRRRAWPHRARNPSPLGGRPTSAPPQPPTLSKTPACLPSPAALALRRRPQPRRMLRRSCQTPEFPSR